VPSYRRHLGGAGEVKCYPPSGGRVARYGPPPHGADTPRLRGGWPCGHTAASNATTPPITRTAKYDCTPYQRLC